MPNALDNTLRMFFCLEMLPFIFVLLSSATFKRNYNKLASSLLSTNSVKFEVLTH